ncbi:MAG TPA: pyridoxamine 5'-phosphate oxidase family protein [Kofleriaceae bacterium]
MDHLSKLLSILRSTDTVVLLTRTAERIAGRPMALVDVDDDGTIYLTTAIGSQKAVEIAADPAVNVTAQTSKGIVSIEGTARLTQDRAIIDQLWNDSWRIWYPEGRTSPSIAIVVVSPTEGTYWDTSVAHGLSFLWRAVKARISGDEVETDASDVGSVQMRH